MEENKKEDRLLEGAMHYEIRLTEEDIDIRFEQSNENNLIAFTAVQKMYDEMWDKQMEAGSPKEKMSKSDMKELQIARQFLNKHISLLGRFVQEKYKDALFTKDKPKIDIITQADILNNPNLKIIN